MPRTSKGPRLWKRPARRKNGRIVAASVWIIKDGGKHIATGCLAEPSGKRPPAKAERALAAYIADKYQPPRKTRDVDVIDIADVLSIYRQDNRDRQASPKKFDGRIERLNEFFGGKMLGEINSALCAAYVKARGNHGGARRDLEDLRAAIGHHARENLHHAVIHVTLPEKGGPRERWLTREEAARLVWTCWRARETQTVHRGPLKGQKIETDKRPLRHIARFLLIGMYTGTRAGAIASASPERDEGRSFVDLDRGIFYRLAEGKRATNKRQPPVPIPGRTLGAHAALDASRRRAFALRRMERPAGQIREDRVRDRRAAVRAVAEGGEDLAAYACATRRRLGLCSGVPIRGRRQAFSACRSRCCSTPTAIIIRTTCARPQPRLRRRIASRTYRWSKRWLTSKSTWRASRKLLSSLVGPAGLEPATRPL